MSTPAPNQKSGHSSFVVEHDGGSLWYVWVSSNSTDAKVLIAMCFSQDEADCIAKDLERAAAGRGESNWRAIRKGGR